MQVSLYARLFVAVNGANGLDGVEPRARYWLLLRNTGECFQT